MLHGILNPPYLKSAMRRTPRLPAATRQSMSIALNFPRWKGKHRAYDDQQPFEC